MLDTLQYVLGAGSGVLVGFVLGLVGGGGSILAVPLMVYLVGVPNPHVAIGTSALAVAANALTGLLNHIRRGHVKWRCSLVFAAAGVAGAFAGSSAGKAFDGERLLFLFAVVMVVVGVLMLRNRMREDDPGVVLGRDNAPKLVGYGLQLREKQKARRYYRILEGQFRNLYEKAVNQKGITGELMLSTLERRLDNVVYRMGLATSRAQGRQLVRHGHLTVNGKKVNIPSFVVKPGDSVEIRESSRNNTSILGARDATAHTPSPSWLEVDRDALRGRVLQQPKRDELVQIQLNEQLIVELYSK